LKRLLEFNFVSEKYGPLENCSKWHDIINDLKFGAVEPSNNPKWGVTPNITLTSEVYDMITKSSNIKIDERLIMKAVKDMSINDYMDRLLAIDCLKRGMILAHCTITGEQSVIA